MADKTSMELRIKGLEKSMGTMVKAFKELKAGMEALKEKVNKNQEEEIQELIKTQEMLNDMAVTNCEAIKRIDIEIEKHQKQFDYNMDEVNKALIKEKKCKYFDKGYCKYKSECKFAHSEEICKPYLEGRKCKENACKDRHPKVCKWWLKGGCRRTDCAYLHVTLVHDDDEQNKAHKYFPCYSCKNCFDDRTCVVPYMVQNGTIFLCLNCDSWIQKKDRIMIPGWSLFGQNGDLRRDI